MTSSFEQTLNILRSQAEEHRNNPLGLFVKERRDEIANQLQAIEKALYRTLEYASVWQALAEYQKMMARNPLISHSFIHQPAPTIGLSEFPVPGIVDEFARVPLIQVPVKYARSVPSTTFGVSSHEMVTKVFLEIGLDTQDRYHIVEWEEVVVDKTTHQGPQPWRWARSILGDEELLLHFLATTIAYENKNSMLFFSPPVYF